MSNVTEWTLSVSESSGPREPRAWTNPMTGAVEMYQPYNHPCPGCKETTTAGEIVTCLEGDWWHARCAKVALQTASPDRVWLALGSQVARRPSHFTAAEIKTVMGKVLEIAARSVEDSDRVVGFQARAGAR